MLKVVKILSATAHLTCKNRVWQTLNLQQSSSLFLATRKNYFSSERPNNTDEQPRGRNIDAESENITMEKKKKNSSILWTSWRIFFWSSVALLGYSYYLNENYAEPAKQIGAVPFFLQSANTIKGEIVGFIDFFTKPPSKKLLPDVPIMMPGMDYPKTLVLNLSGTLVHTDFVFGKGAQIKLRPQLYEFLKIVANMYEVVLFTDDDQFFVQSVIEKIDPQHQIFAQVLGREAMVYEKGKHFKDLRYLNRDLRKIIVVETNKEMLQKHSENGIYVPQYSGEGSDKTLSELIPLLVHLTKPQVADIREELKIYGNDNPGKKFLEQVQAQQQALAQQQKRGLTGIFTSQQKNQNQFEQYKRI